MLQIRDHSTVQFSSLANRLLLPGLRDTSAPELWLQVALVKRGFAPPHDRSHNSRKCFQAAMVQTASGCLPAIFRISRANFAAAAKASFAASWA